MLEIKQWSDIGHFPTKTTDCLNDFGFIRTKCPDKLYIIFRIMYILTLHLQYILIIIYLDLDLIHIIGFSIATHRPVLYY